MLKDPEFLPYLPYALAGMLFGWKREDVDDLGVEELYKILSVGLSLWKETNVLNLLGKALGRVGRLVP